ncbi:MAG: c-type cytochrome [Roseinatronobacter sp.]
MSFSRVTMMAPAFALVAGLGLGNAQASESRWRDCRTCHAIEAPDGQVIERGGRSGPNLYGIANRPIASDRGFRFFSDDLRAAGQTGARWTADNFVAYLADPDQFLRSVTGNPDASSGMHVQLRTGGRELFDWLQQQSR